MKIYLALAAIAFLIPFYLIGVATAMLIDKLWSWGTE